ncbi:amino acid ABC transporter permease [Pseudokineococcus basanitobsidens]|uniref:Amino acid ABC transporter permease n=1 Tax=Pseudokineococcus basanitobsidens TaxID=1926649 RepID=A0ABU8RLZ5_9ACTN
MTTQAAPRGRRGLRETLRSPRRRARLSRGVQYAVLVVALVLLVSLADLGEIRRAFFNTEVAAAQLPAVITVALVNTVIYTLLGFVLAFALGLVLALMRLSTVAPYRWIATVYIEAFRGLPALLVFIAIGTGIPLAFPGVFLDRYLAVTLALGLVGAAYIGETIRAGIQAVPRGQVEAARSLGMSQTRATVTIVIPQAFRIILPPLTNELIILTKDSSLTYVLGSTFAQQELTQFGRNALNQYQSLTPVLVAGLCYLVITVPLGFVVRRLESRTARSR